MSRRLLVTGVSGSGKSTLEQVFKEKGYQTADIDNGYAEWQYKDSGLALGHHPKNAEELGLVHWALKSDELKLFLEGAKSTALIFGSTNDLHRYIEMFDSVVLLEYPNNDAVVSRLLTRPDHGYGKTSHERDSVLSYMDDYQTMMKRLGAKVVDCTLPLEQIVQVIEAEVENE